MQSLNLHELKTSQADRKTGIGQRTRLRGVLTLWQRLLLFVVVVGVLVFAGVALAAEPSPELSQATVENQILDQITRGQSIDEPLANWRSTGPDSADEPPIKAAPNNLGKALLELRRSLPSKTKATLDTPALATAWEIFEAWDLLQRNRFERTAARLAAAGLGGEPSARLEQVRNDWQAFSDRLESLRGEPLAELKAAPNS